MNNYWLFDWHYKTVVECLIRWLFVEGKIPESSFSRLHVGTGFVHISQNIGHRKQYIYYILLYMGREHVNIYRTTHEIHGKQVQIYRIVLHFFICFQLFCIFLEIKHYKVLKQLQSIVLSYILFIHIFLHFFVDIIGN